MDLYKPLCTRVRCLGLTESCTEREGTVSLLLQQAHTGKGVGVSGGQVAGAG